MDCGCGSSYFTSTPDRRSRPSRALLEHVAVFKPQSPMSVGVWTLLGFSGAAAATAFAGFMGERNYTGVLIGATAIPVWNQNVGDLPIHFAASGLGAAVGLLEMMGNDKSCALQALGLGAALFECWEGLRIEGRGHSHLDPLKLGRSGWMIRAGGVLSGPVPFALRATSLFGGNKHSSALRRWAGISALAGSLVTRIAWVQAGHTSAHNWREPLQIPGADEAELLGGS